MEWRRMTKAGFGLAVVLASLAACGPGDFRSDVLSAGARPWTAAPQARPDAFRFAVIGDRTGLARPGVFEQAMRQIGWLQPDFVLSVGDIIEGYSDDAGQVAAEWNQVDAAIATLGLPFFHVAGNHDYNSPATVAAWETRHGPAYCSFRYGDVLFLVLNSEDPPMPMPADMQAQFQQALKGLNADPVAFEKAMHEQLAGANAARQKDAEKSAEESPETALNLSRFSDTQVAWVEKTLQDNRDARWTMVLMHKPGWRVDAGNFARIEAALDGRPHTMIAAHYHYFTHEVRKGHDYYTMGTTGGIAHQDGPGKMDHIAWFTMTKDGPRLALIRLTGVLDKEGNSGLPANAY